MNMRDDNRNTYIDTLYNVLLSQDLCDQLFSIIRSIDFVHILLFKYCF